MKKVVLLALLIMSLSFLTQFSYADNISGKTPGTITVYSNKSKDVEPDVAQMIFSVRTNAKTVEAATSENKVITNKIISALKQKMDLTKGDQIKTSDFSVYPQYTYPKEGKPILVGYNVQNSVNVKTKKVSSIASLIDLAIKNGANQLNNLSFSLSDEKTSCDDLYASAIKDVQSQASIISKALNSSVSSVKTITANCNTESANRVYGAVMMKGVSESSDNISTPIESGKIKVNVSITAEFYVQ